MAAVAAAKEFLACAPAPGYNKYLKFDERSEERFYWFPLLCGGYRSSRDERALVLPWLTWRKKEQSFASRLRIGFPAESSKTWLWRFVKEACCLSEVKKLATLVPLLLLSLWLFGWCWLIDSLDSMSFFCMSLFSLFLLAVLASPAFLPVMVFLSRLMLGLDD